MSAKRKRSENSEVPEERLFKKFEVLESRLEQLGKLWTNNDSDQEDNSSLISLDASATDMVSYADDNGEQELDEDEDDEDYNEESFIEELPQNNEPIEEVLLSDEELSNIWQCENSQAPSETPSEVPSEVPSEDIVFLNEKTKENGYPSTSFHPDIRETWTVWTRKGISFNDKQDLLEKYAPPKFLRTPQVNPEILATLHKRPIEKDEFVRTSQEMVSSALTSLGSVMSMLLSEHDIDKLKMLNNLNDTAKILTDLFHFDSDKRRSNIISWKPKPVQSLLASTKPDEYLFGKNLKLKISEAQKSGRMGELKPYVFKRNNNRPYKYFPSPYHWFGNEEEDKGDDKDFVLNPLKQEAKDTKLMCKLEKFDKFEIKIE